MTYPVDAKGRRDHRAHITAVKITRAKVEARELFSSINCASGVHGRCRPVNCCCECHDDQESA